MTLRLYQMCSNGKDYLHLQTLFFVRAQAYLTLCNPMCCSPPGSSVHRIYQARILEWVAISSSRGSSFLRDWIQISCLLNCQADSLPLSHQVVHVWSLGQEDLLEEEMATYSSILAWEIPWTEEPDRLQSMGLQRIGHNLATEHKKLCDTNKAWRDDSEFSNLRMHQNHLKGLLKQIPEHQPILIQWVWKGSQWLAFLMHS